MFYNRIKILRKENGYTQKYIATILNVSQATYSKYERGMIAVPAFYIKILSKIFNTSTDYLLGLTDDPKPHPPKK